MEAVKARGEGWAILLASGGREAEFAEAVIGGRTGGEARELRKVPGFRFRETRESPCDLNAE